MAEHLASIAHAEEAKPTSSSPDALGYAVGLLTWILAAGVCIAAKSAVAELPPWSLVFWRVLIAALALLPFVLGHRRAIVDFLKRRWLEALIVGAIGLGITQGLMFTALRYTSAINVGIIFAISPIVTLSLARIVLGEGLGPWQVAGSFAAFLGIVVITARGSLATLLAFDFSPGDLLVIAAAITFACYTVALRRAKFELPRLPLLVVMLLGAVIATLPLFLYELSNGEHGNLALKGYLALLYAAIPGGAVMYLLYNWSIEILGASRAGSLLYSQMVFTAILAWLILGEPIEWYHLAGAALIIVGVALVTVFKARAPTSPAR